METDGHIGFESQIERRVDELGGLGVALFKAERPQHDGQPGLLVADGADPLFDVQRRSREAPPCPAGVVPSTRCSTGGDFRIGAVVGEDLERPDTWSPSPPSRIGESPAACESCPDAELANSTATIPRTNRRITGALSFLMIELGWPCLLRRRGSAFSRNERQTNRSVWTYPKKVRPVSLCQASLRVVFQICEFTGELTNVLSDHPRPAPQLEQPY